MSQFRKHNCVTKILSVIIVAYNSDKHIANCIDSIYRHNDLNEKLEIILVDNSPPENGFCANLCGKYKEIVFIRNSKNVGFGGANNIGAAYSRGKYLLFLNPDTIIIEKFFVHIVDEFEDDPFLAICGIKLVSKSLRPQQSFMFRKEYSTLFSDVFAKILNRLDVFLPTRMITSGTCMFVRKGTFVKAGMFDPSIFLYGEESYLAWAIKALDSRYRFGYIPWKRIIHLHDFDVIRPHEKYNILYSQTCFLERMGGNPERNLRRLTNYNRVRRVVNLLLGNKGKVADSQYNLDMLASFRKNVCGRFRSKS